MTIEHIKWYFVMEYEVEIAEIRNKIIRSHLKYQSGVHNLDSEVTQP